MQKLCNPQSILNIKIQLKRNALVFLFIYSAN